MSKNNIKRAICVKCGKHNIIKIEDIGGHYENVKEFLCVKCCKAENWQSKMCTKCPDINVCSGKWKELFIEEITKRTQPND